MSLPAWIFASAEDDPFPSASARAEQMRTEQAFTDSEIHAASSANPSDAPAALMTRLRAGDTTALDELYRAWYIQLVRFAALTGPSPAIAEEIVQDVFAAVWEGRTRLAIHGSWHAYLFTA